MRGAKRKDRGCSRVLFEVSPPRDPRVLAHPFSTIPTPPAQIKRCLSKKRRTRRFNLEFNPVMPILPPSTPDNPFESFKYNEIQQFICSLSEDQILEQLRNGDLPLEVWDTFAKTILEARDSLSCSKSQISELKTELEHLQKEAAALDKKIIDLEANRTEMLSIASLDEDAFRRVALCAKNIKNEFDERVSALGWGIEYSTSSDLKAILWSFKLSHLSGALQRNGVSDLETLLILDAVSVPKFTENKASFFDIKQLFFCQEMIRLKVFWFFEHETRCTICSSNVENLMNEYGFPSEVLYLIKQENKISPGRLMFIELSDWLDRYQLAPSIALQATKASRNLLETHSSTLCCDFDFY